MQYQSIERPHLASRPLPTDDSRICSLHLHHASDISAHLYASHCIDFSQLPDYLHGHQLFLESQYPCSRIRPPDRVSRIIQLDIPIQSIDTALCLCTACRHHRNIAYHSRPTQSFRSNCRILYRNVLWYRRNFVYLNPKSY